MFIYEYNICIICSNVSTYTLEHIAPLHTTWSFIPQASKALPKEGQEAEVLGDKNWRPFRACL